MNLSTSIEEIPRIGSAYQKKLKKLGIKTVRDLLFHFPHRYEDFSGIAAISKVKAGEIFCIQGKILEIENIRTWKKRMILTQTIIEDKSGVIKVVWFNQPYLKNVLKKGERVCLAGKVVRGEDGLYFSNPSYEKIMTDLTHTGRIIPVYPETEGLSSRWLRMIIKPLLFHFKNKIFDPLPEKIRNRYQLPNINQAIWQIHFPDSMELAKKARNRFSFEELFNISLLVLRERQKLSRERAVSISLNLSLLKDFVKSLPFKLTNAQKKSVWQILKDLEKPRPMNRLLEGDVGSGKTVVATIATLNTKKAGYQIAFMAPTEILAKQHFKTVWELLKNFGVSIGLLTGKENKIARSLPSEPHLKNKSVPYSKIYSKKFKSEIVKTSRKKLLEKTRGGVIDILIGTHALIQERVKFKNLALVILDEQHRFGVEQRARLCQTGSEKIKFIPHLLSMTATPIPRTLALSIYGDLDLSLIDELPKGRKKIITKVVASGNRQKAYNFIRKEVKKGRQVFVICPRIEENSKRKILSWAEVRAVKEEYEKLSEIVFPDLNVGMLHGKMTSKEKEKIMKDFKKKKIDVLVSTSVVEVGVDIPNATVMMIEGAERFGLSQLHQFRGRVGRSKYQSFCFLFTDSPAKKTGLRLKALLGCENGFELAEKDLEIRGPGAINGTRQWGIPDLTMSSIKDIFLVERTRSAAKEILEEDPEFKKYPLLWEKLGEFKKRVHLE